MKKYWIVFLAPVVLLLEGIAINCITSLISMKSDMAVLAGVVLMCGFLAVNFYGVSFIIKKFRK